MSQDPPASLSDEELEATLWSLLHQPEPIDIMEEILAHLNPVFTSVP